MKSVREQVTLLETTSKLIKNYKIPVLPRIFDARKQTSKSKT